VGLQGNIARETLLYGLQRFAGQQEDVKFATRNSLVVEILNCEAARIQQLVWRNTHADIGQSIDASLVIGINESDYDAIVKSITREHVELSISLVLLGMVIMRVTFISVSC